MRNNILLAALLTFTGLSLIMSFNSVSVTDSKRHFENDGDTSAPRFINAKAHMGKNVVSKKGAVSFSSGLDNDYYQLDSTGRTGYLYIETKLDKFINENSTRIPLNLAIVIDHSGSMAGDKMIYAKKAATEIIDKLMPDDFVSVVIYDDNVTVIQPSIQVLDKNVIKSRIDKIVTGGSTNLWGGTEKGYEQVKNTYKKNYVNRVLLISDGLANVGITSPYEIKKRVQQFKDNDGITLSSFGVGLDYNELLMTDMAESGAGNYYFIESPDKMAALFDKELNGMLNVVAQNAELKITLPRGIQLEKVVNNKHTQTGNDVLIQFRDLFSEETKGVLIKFSIDDYANVALKFISTLSYDEVNSKSRESLVNENILSPSGDRELYVTHFNETVIQQSILYTANENMEKAMLKADNGDYDGAKELIQANGTYLQNFGSYALKSEELQKMTSANGEYEAKLSQARTMSADSVKLMQKSNRAESYKIRNKKQ